MGASLLNGILFPAFESKQTIKSLKSYYPDLEMFSISRQNRSTRTAFMPYLNKENKSQISQKALLFFHGNAEDLSQTIHWLSQMQKVLKVNIFANQYPGYGVYQNLNHDFKPTPKDISDEALILYKFVNEQLQFDHSDIIVVGRSIGSGPACHIAGNTYCETLVLISPFYNIKSMIKQKTFNFMNTFFSEVFPNDENIRRTKAKLLNIHGKRDDVINVTNSLNIQKIFQTEKIAAIRQFIYPPHMTHNNFDLKNDIINPIKRFINWQPQFNTKKEKIFTQINKLKME